jgi:DNA-binding MarR family transcriptional regulator
MSRGIRESLRAELADEMRSLQTDVDALDEAVAAHLRVNRTDLRCLDVLIQAGSATPGQLGTRLGLTTGSVTAMLDRLAKLGYLTRAADPADRRKVVVAPTALALRKAGEIYGPLAEAGSRDIARYTEAELRLLLDFLRRSRKLQQEHLSRVKELRR